MEVLVNTEVHVTELRVRWPTSWKHVRCRHTKSVIAQYVTKKWLTRRAFSEIGRKEGQKFTEKEEDRKKKTRNCARKRSRSKGGCELSEEREEKEVKIRRKLKAESADHGSISDKDLLIVAV